VGVAARGWSGERRDEAVDDVLDDAMSSLSLIAESVD